MSARSARALRAVLVLAGAVALAFPGHGFIRLTNNGAGLRFPSQPVRFTVHAAGSDDIPADTGEATAIRLGFDAWSRIDGSALVLQESQTGASGPRVHANDGLNLVMFDEQNETGMFTGASFIIAITPVFFDSGGTILDADIVYNGRDHRFATDLSAGRYDVLNIATHEIGHFIGLDHSGVSGASLVPFAYQQESRLRSLSNDDRAGAIANYPDAGAAALCSVTGQAIRDANGQGIFGAHVVAVNAATGEPESACVTSPNGGFTIEMLRAGTYRVYAEPLDGPCADQNLQLDGIETSFATAFYGGVATPAEFALAPGQRNVQLGQLRLRERGSAFNLEAVNQSLVVRGTTATIALSGAGIQPGQEVEVAGAGVVLSATPPQNRGTLGPSLAFTCSVNAGAALGLRDIYVYRGAGAAREMVALPGGFEVSAAAPALASVAPGEGASRGGDAVVLAGTNFLPGARVLFGAEIAPIVIFDSSTRLTVTTPPAPVGTVTVTVLNPDGQQARRTGAFTFLGIPGIAAVEPAAGPSAGGVPVTIRGEQFAASAQVLFDARAASAVAVLDGGTRITCLAPSGPAGTSADVTVVNPGGSGGSDTLVDGYRWIDPRIIALDPAAGQAAGGTLVQVMGDGFSPVSRVDFGSRTSPQVTFVSQFELRARTPPAVVVGTVSVTVVTSDGRTALAASAFRYVDATDPQIASVSPARGPQGGGTLVRVPGAFFEQPAVFFGLQPAAATTVVSANELLVTTPPSSSAGAVDLVVRNQTTGLQAKAFGAFTFDAPAGGGVQPRSGGGGGGCQAVPGADPGAAGRAGALLPLLTALGALAIMRGRRRAHPAAQSAAARSL